ncbi:MAG: hypothetical protein NVS4B6_11740 [Mycobacterium sp.]
MHFTSETSSNGVIERNFVVDGITGVLWSPASGTVGSPLLLAGHSGGMHKKAPGLLTDEACENIRREAMQRLAAIVALRWLRITHSITDVLAVAP